ncbi:hypothetical protein [Cesiribacter sp. SM1]|uniref:hypothetical protein n=1 Tax=Cesiribacter sp. SM1 TaxID=2861196 RepID=UPI001CD29643|nr:hypothetical protein [Cesiribacter sp. SM1]
MLQKSILQKIRHYACFTGLFLLLLAAPPAVYAQLQDNIYLIDETAIKNVDIIQIDSKKIKYLSKSGKDQALNSRQVIMAFNAQGRYLVFPGNEAQIASFFSAEKELPKADLIVTLSEQVIPGSISTEDALQVNFDDLATKEKSKKISTAELAAIIYKDGSHKLFTSPSQASSILTSLSEKISATRLTTYDRTEPPAQLVSSTAAVAATPSAPPVLKEAEPVLNATLHELKTDSVAAVAPAPEESEVPHNPLEIDHALYSRKALQKTEDLSTYLAVISSKSTAMAEVDKAVEMAVRLFINEDAQVEVSSKAGRTRHKIRAYLTKLKLLKYDKVEIHWTDISYVSDLKKGVDGNYYGIITLQQRFNGFLDGQLVYSDLTEKNVEVMVKAYQKEVDGERQEMWDVFLSDIGVVVTKFE